VKEAKSETLRPTSPGIKSRGIDDSPFCQQVRRCCSLMSQLLAESTVNEQNRNRLVSSIKEEMKALREDIKHQLQEVSKHITFLKGNNQKVNLMLNDEGGYKSKRPRSAHEEPSDDMRYKQKY